MAGDRARPARASPPGSVSLSPDLPLAKSVLGRGPITAIFINLRRQESRRVATFKTQFGAAWRRGASGFLVALDGPEAASLERRRLFQRERFPS